MLVLGALGIFPRIPFHPDFWRWANWGEKLMALHIGYESVAPRPLTRTYTPSKKRAARILDYFAALAKPRDGSKQCLF